MTGGYIIEKSETRYFCVAACVNSVIGAYGFERFSQRELSEKMGITVPPDMAGEIPGARVSEREWEWGVSLREAGGMLQQFFDENGVCMEINYMHVSMIERTMMAYELERYKSCGFDVMVGFDYGLMRGKERNVGHVGVVVAVDTDREVVVVGDPGPEGWGEHEVHGDLLFAAMMKKNAGLWCFRRK